MEKKKFLIISGSCKSLLNFRGDLLREIVKKNYKVYAIAPKDDFNLSIYNELADLGVNLITIYLKRGGLNPFTDLKSIYHIKKIILSIRPSKVLAYNIKPVIYSGLVLRKISFCDFFPLITGLGYSFTGGINSFKRGIISRLVSKLYKYSLQSSKRIIFQNKDDLNYFYKNNLISKSLKVGIVNGSGVNLNKFPQSKMPAKNSFLMAARIIKDKGVYEFYEAAKLIKKEFPDAIFNLAGSIDYENPSSISAGDLRKLNEENIVNYLGNLDNIATELQSCRFFVLPSYREGTPRAILEALSVGRPVITTSAPGCKETVIDKFNGFIVKPRDTKSLYMAMKTILKKSDFELEKIANNSRTLAEDKFDVRLVNRDMIKYMNI